ncbi:MAG: translin family protein [Promethearchaeota archaeon]
MNEQLQETFDKIRQSLDEADLAREEILRLNRIIIRNSSLAIRALHKRNFEKACELIENNKNNINSVKEKLLRFKEQPPLGLTLTAFQEYGEASLFLAFLQKKDFPTPEELGLPYLSYLLALADTAGELRRYTLDCVRREEPLEEPERAIALMDEIYYGLSSLDYPDGLIPGVRRKTDMVRAIVERTRGDLALVHNRLSLKMTLESYHEKLENKNKD